MDMSDENRRKYLKPPPFELILEFINELKVTYKQFERFYSIPKTTITQIGLGNRELPAKFWHIVYEKIVPVYGMNFNQKEYRKTTKPLTRVRYSKKSNILDKII